MEAVIKSKSFLIALVIFLFPVIANAAVYYVSESDGRDLDRGTSLAAAFRTIQRAAKVARAGDTVYIRAGDYNEAVSMKHSGTASNRITFTSYHDEAVTVRGKVSSSACIAIIGDYITVDGLRIKHQNPCRRGAQVIGMYIYGDYAAVTNCSFTGSNGYSKYMSPCRARESGIDLKGADNVYIYGNTINELSFHGIRIEQNGTDVPYRWVVKNNSIKNSVDGNGLMIMGTASSLQGGLIDGNVIWGSLVSDGIQSNGDMSSVRPAPANWGVIIRNNHIYNVAENCVDPKGCRYYVIENNVLHGGTGNNDGTGPGDGNFDGMPDVMGGNGGINCGTNQLAHDIIVRGNIIYDNAGGSPGYDGWRFYNNTFINNDRDYTGPNSTLSTFPRLYMGINSYRPDIKIVNNIFGGHRTCDVTINTSYSNNYIDYNLYTNDVGSPTVCDVAKGPGYAQYTFSGWRSRCRSRPILGDDAHSIVGNPGFINASSDSYGAYSSLDFGLKSTSPARDSGGPLTTATNSASRSSILTVADGKFFSSGMGAVGVSGDHVMVGGKIAQITRKNGNTLYLDRKVKWSRGAPVIWCPNHQCPEDGKVDMGALQYGDRGSRRGKN